MRIEKMEIEGICGKEALDLSPKPMGRPGPIFSFMLLRGKANEDQLQFNPEIERSAKSNSEHFLAQARLPDKNLGRALTVSLMRESGSVPYSSELLPHLRKNIFCNGLKLETKMILDATAGGTMMVVDAEQDTRIIAALSSTNMKTQHNQRSVQKRVMLDLNTSDAILAKNKILTQQIEALIKQMSNLPQQLHAVQSAPSQQQVLRCDFCGGLEGQSKSVLWLKTNVRVIQHTTTISATIQTGSTPTIAWKTNQTGGHFRKVHASFNDKLEEYRSKYQELETHVGQLAKYIAEQHSDRQQFPANTQTNPKEHCNVITTRSGKVISQDVGVNLAVEEEVLRDKEIEGEKDKQHCFRVDVIDELYMMSDIHLHSRSTLEKALMGEFKGRDAEEEKCTKNCVVELDGFREVSSQQVQIEEFSKTHKTETRKLELKMLSSYLKYAFLEEVRFTAYESSKLYKEKVKMYHDNKIRRKDFQPSQSVLLVQFSDEIVSGKSQIKVVRTFSGQISKVAWGD
ncbi:hypothetical protein Lal_00021374 [Lupinus albus]|nr:hypothetical protein Lal_00021374 [Lupinus albus]